MNPKTKRGILLTLPLLIGGGLIYWMNKKASTPKKGSKPVNATDADQKPVDNPVNTKPIVTSEFPLQKGSRNDKVKELQTAIGLTGKDVDGIFGSGTESKLFSFAGVKIVQDQAQLDSIKQLAIGISNQARAESLVKKFLAGGVALMCTKDTDMQQYVQDSYGAITYMKKFLPLYQGKVYNNQDYKLIGYSKLGKLQVQITNGALSGMWAVDPNSVTVTNV